MTFEERRLARVERFKELAEKAEAEARATKARASEMASFIPMGQPILIGHHSESRDRRFRDRIHNLEGKAWGLYEKAEYYARRAQAVENNRTISSDDPDAVKRLKEKLAHLENSQACMVAVNKAWRAHKKPAVDNSEAWEAIKEDKTLLDLGIKPEWIDNIRLHMASDPLNRGPFPSYSLSNNSSEISRVKKRIEHLEQQNNRKEQSHELAGVEIKENVEANRVQIIFPDIPSETIRTELKSNGFRWSRYNKAWQRHLNDYAVDLAKQIVSKHCQ